MKEKNVVCFGIDVSKDKLDIMSSDGEYLQVPNTKKGYKELLKVMSLSDYVVMEATGYYHYQLAYFMIENNRLVSVANPLSVKRFIQMTLSKIKTDKSDAKMICQYGLKVEQSWWSGHSKSQQECLQLLSLVETYQKQMTMIKNKIHGEKVLSKPSSKVFDCLNQTLKHFQKQINKLESKVESLVRLDYQKELTLLESIPGIGRKTSMFLLVITDGLNRFERGSQLCSFAGITPIIRTSGSSVKGKAKISKIGNSKLRNLLFLCSFNACKYNKACKALYERIVNKGKSKKLALLAVCNKLLRQAFSIVKSGLPYDENLVSIKPV